LFFVFFIGEQNETNQRWKFVGVCGLYVFYVTIFRDINDKKFFRTMFEMYKKIPILHLHADVTFSIPEFFAKTLVKQTKKNKMIN